MTTASEVAEALEARAAVHEELAVAARLDAVAAEHENDADLHRTAAVLLRTLSEQIEAKDRALEPFALVAADYIANGLDDDDVIIAGRTPWHIKPDQPIPSRITFRDLRAARTAKDGQ